MVEYGVATTNKFHFLSDEEGANPDEILSKASQIKKQKGPIVKKPAAAPVETNVAKPERAFANKENEGNRNRGNNRGRGQREGGERRRDGGEHRREGGDRPPRTSGDRERGERRGRGRGFGGGERRPRPQNHESDAPATEGTEDRVEGERPFRRGRGAFRRGGTRGDRVSGSDVTGVRPRDKRQGHGKGNWGTDQDEIKGETEPLNEVDGDKSTENVNPEAEQEHEKEEEKPSGITLAEWKKRQQQDEAQNFNVRKPNIDKKLNLIPVKRTEEDEEDKQEEYVYVQRESRHKHIDIPVNFNTGNARSFANRDRGDRRGGRGRGGDRSGGRSGRGQGFNLTQEAFPAL